MEFYVWYAGESGAGAEVVTFELQVEATSGKAEFASGACDIAGMLTH